MSRSTRKPWARELHYSTPKSLLLDGAREQLIKPSKPLVRKIHEQLKEDQE